MFECSTLFEKEYRKPKQIPMLGKQGVVELSFGGRLNSAQIKYLLEKIHFIISIYKHACKKIVFICNGVFIPKDMFSYVLFETFIYTLKIIYRYDVEYIIDKAETNFFIPGLMDSQLIHFHKANYDEKLMEKTYNKIHTGNHFRRIISCGDIDGVAVLLGELKIFFRTFDFGNDYGIQLARVATELADNASEHAEADCLVDIYVSDPTYRKTGSDNYYYAISMVVIDFSEKRLNTAIRKKIENKDYGESKRYQIVSEAYEKHREYFDNLNYFEEDFYNVASFQDRISGRYLETESGGTGLTEMIKSIEDKAEVHQCYVLSGSKGLWLEPEYLKYNDDNWIGFNKENNFSEIIPDLGILVRSDVEFTGTGYNFVLVLKKENV